MHVFDVEAGACFIAKALRSLFDLRLLVPLSVRLSTLRMHMHTRACTQHTQHTRYTRIHTTYTTYTLHTTYTHNSYIHVNGWVLRWNWWNVGFCVCVCM